MTLCAPQRWLAATTLAAVVTCVLAATGVFAPCHQGEAPMSCCPDSSQAPTAGPQASIAPLALTASFVMLQPVATAAPLPPPEVSILGHQRGLYLRLSTLLI